MTAPRENTIALGLGASYLGYVTHAGFIAGLEEGGVRPGHFAGASSGALAAAMHSVGYSAEETRTLFLEPRFRRKWFDLGFELRFLASIIHVPGQVGMLTGRSMHRHLRKLFAARADHGPAHPPRLSIAVTNLTTGRSEWKEGGDIARWIVASCAVPGIFQHQHIDGHDYIDGGMADCLPASGWLDEPSLESIILHRIVPPSGTRRRPWNFSRVMARSHETITEEMFKLQVALLRRAGKKVIVATTECARPSLFAGRRSGERLWELGRMSGRKVAAELSPSAAAPKEQSACPAKNP